jgi:hypothetical protein
MPSRISQNTIYVLAMTIDEHILGETNEFFERYKFNTCDQKNSITPHYGIWRKPVDFATACVTNSSLIV